MGDFTLTNKPFDTTELVFGGETELLYGKKGYLFVQLAFFATPYLLKHSVAFSPYFSGAIIVDRLLYLGNGPDRFIVYEVKDGTVVADSGMTKPFKRTHKIRLGSNAMLAQHPSVVLESNLNKLEKKLLLRGVSI